MRHHQLPQRASFEPLEPRRLFAAGDPDVSFGVGGRAVVPIERGEGYGDAVVLGDDKILMAGSSNPTFQFDGGRYLLRRLNADGTPDTTFGDSGGVTIGDFTATANNGSHIRQIVVQDDGKIVALGKTWLMAALIARFNADGSLDNTFGGGDGVVENAGGPFGLDVIDVQADGKIVGAGDNDVGVARFNADGSLDATFGTGGTTPNTIAQDFPRIGVIKVQSDDKILIGGGAHDGDALRFALARLNADGSFDTAFGDNGQVTTTVAGGGANFNLIEDITLLPGGKILAAGQADGPVSPIAGGGGVEIVRYNADGSVDQAFGNTAAGGGIVIPFGSSIPVRNVDIDDDGNAVIIGDQQHDGLAVTRVTPAGQLDESFGRAISFGSGEKGRDAAVFVVGGGLDSDGNVIVAGHHNIFLDSNVDVRREAFVARLLADDAAPSPVTNDPVKRILRIGGTSGDDLIEVAQLADAFYAARNGFGRVFEAGDVRLISAAGGAGDDEILALHVGVPAHVSGGDGRDRIVGGDANDRLEGNPGRDFIDGGLGPDLIIGGPGNDQLRGEGGKDRVYGRGGNDHLQGNGGDDRLDGGDGVDILGGGAGADLLLAADGAIDELFGDGGRDSADADDDDVLASVEFPQ
jgi:uncharacterized delta-60 repeat protein